MMRRMLSVASLAAFSGSGINPVHPTPVRAPASPPPDRPKPPPVQGAPAGIGEGAAAPSRILPRGSLLDLSA
jgi:hypothetical protein